MVTARSVLCPVDLSEQSRRALRWAAAIARYRNADLTVLSVVEPLLVQAAAIRLGIDLAQSEIEPALSELVASTLPDDVRRSVRVRLDVKAGEPAAVILDTARGIAPGLIVIGTHGLGGLRKLLLGSTTEQVLRRTAWPILAVPDGATRVPAPHQSGARLKRILLATDFRESANAAVQWASALASEIAVPLLLAHVVEPVNVPSQWPALAPEFENDRIASGRQKLAALSASLRLARTEGVVAVGRRAETIASVATEHGASIVVMGLARRGDSQSHAPGATAYRVLRTAHVPVVVVPLTEARDGASVAGGAEMSSR